MTNAQKKFCIFSVFIRVFGNLIKPSETDDFRVLQVDK